MIISHGRGYVFVHIPKTGGTSLAMALEQRAMRDDILVGDTPKAQRRAKRQRDLPARGRLWKHSTLADIDGVVMDGDLDRFFVFTMVRNPWDRVVSYYHWLRGQSFDHAAVALARNKGFSAFLNDPSTRTGLEDWPAARYVTTAAGRERCDAGGSGRVTPGRTFGRRANRRRPASCPGSILLRGDVEPDLRHQPFGDQLQ